MSFLENLNLETILNRIEDLVNNDSDFKANYSKVRKRKSEKEERVFIAKFNQILSQLVEYKDGRSMVHIFHLRFIHTNVHSKKTRVPKLIAIITEYLRLINKSYINAGSEIHYIHNSAISSTPSHSSPIASSVHLNSSPNFSLTSSNPNVYITSLAVDNNNHNNHNNHNSNNHNINSHNESNDSLEQFENNNNVNNSTNNSSNSLGSAFTSQEDLEVITINFSSPQQQGNSGGTPNYNSASNTPNYFSSSSSSSSSPILQSHNSSGNINNIINNGNNGNNNNNSNNNNSVVFKLDFSQEIKIAKELLDYLATHHIDPDNSLVGCDVNPIYLDSVFRLRSQNSFNERSLIKMIKSWGAMKDDHLIKEVRKMANNLNNLDFKKGELVIIEYMEQEKDQQSQSHHSHHSTNNHSTPNEINTSSGSDVEEDQFDFDDSLDNIPQSSLTTGGSQSQNLTPQISLNNSINNNSNNSNSNNEKQDQVNRVGSYIFARFEEEVGRTCKVYIIPTEDSKQLLSVNINNIYKITPEIIETAKNEKYIDLVNDPSKPFFHMLAFKERELINDYLGKKKVDVSILDKCRNNSASILDLPNIKSTMEAIKDLNKNIQTTNLLSEVRKMARLESKSFLENARKTCFYIPLYNKMEEIVKNIENIRESELRTSIQQSLISLDTLYYKVHLEKKEILDGSEKGRLSQWWLNLIKDTLNAFLTKNGFSFTAVPADYLEKPPQNMNAVKHNLEILHQILLIPTLIYTPKSNCQSSSISSLTNLFIDQNHQQQLQLHSQPHTPNEESALQKEFRKVVINLAETIYPAIDELVLKSYLVILDCFDMFTSKVSDLESKGYLNLEYVKNLCQSKKDSMTDKSKSPQIEKLIKDIDYCIEMKNLENVPQEKRLDIVTITGLAFGRVHRLENEMRTVVEQWRHIESSPIRISSPLLISSTSSHHHKRAISASNDSEKSSSSSSSSGSIGSNKWSFSTNSNFDPKQQGSAPKFLQSQRKINLSTSSLNVSSGGSSSAHNSNSRPTSPLKNLQNEDSTFSSGDEK